MNTELLKKKKFLYPIFYICSIFLPLLIPSYQYEVVCSVSMEKCVTNDSLTFLDLFLVSVTLLFITITTY